MVATPQPVVISMSDLQTESIKLTTLEQAFGPTSLGILIVKDLPASFQPLRMKLLSYASHLAKLPIEELDKLTDAASHYNVGWSHGKEALKSGKYDTMKGSYYVGVLSSHLQKQISKSIIKEKPSLAIPNLWPPEELLPGFRQTFEELCTLIIDIALLVAKACDKFASQYVQDYVPGLLERILKESTTIRARLLHYFPPNSSPIPATTVNEEDDDSWCTVHVDDGCLTGLTSALFIDESVLPPLSTTTTSTPSVPLDPKAGLYILSRTSEVVKVNIPPDCLAFQTGSALELMTRGAFKAVPHFVRGPSGGGWNSVSRNTLAVFTQPNLGEVVDKKNGLTFGEHTRESDERHV